MRRNSLPRAQDIFSLYCTGDEIVFNTSTVYAKIQIRVNIVSSHRSCSIKDVSLAISQNLLENTCIKVSFLIKLEASACNFIEKETLTQVLSCECCEIFKNTVFTEHLRATASKNKVFIEKWSLDEFCPCY